MFIPITILNLFVLGAVRVGYVDNEIIINPTRKEQQQSPLNLIIAGCKGEKVGKNVPHSYEGLYSDYLVGLLSCLSVPQPVLI